MSIQRLSIASVIAAGALSISTLGFARQPPALRAAQVRAETAACRGSTVVSGASYRNAWVSVQHARFGTHHVGVAAEKGYRETFIRFGVAAPRSGVACREPASRPRFSAGR